MTDWIDLLITWNSIARSQDPLAYYPAAQDFVYGSAPAKADMETVFEHLIFVDAQNNRQLDELGYLTPWPPGLWRRRREAVYQVRLLQLLAQVKPSDHGGKEAFGGLAVRLTCYVDYFRAMPSIVQYKDYKFLILPFAYEELVTFASMALAESLSFYGSAPWKVIIDLGTESRPICPNAPLAARYLIGRILTGPALSDALAQGQGPEEGLLSRLAADNAWFIAQPPAHDNPGIAAIRNVLEYATLDFGLAHELGHLFPARLDENNFANASLWKESSADDWALQLYAESWGWRSDLLEDCPFDVPVRFFLGPFWFFASAKIMFRLRRQLENRLQGLQERDEPYVDPQSSQSGWEQLNSRQAAMQNSLLSLFEKRNLSSENRVIIKKIFELESWFDQNIEKWVSEITDDDLKRSLDYWP